MIPPANTMLYTAITDGKDQPRTDIQVFGAYNRFISARRNAKIYKVLPHLFMDSDWSIWVDGNIHLKKPPEWFLEHLDGNDVMLFSSVDSVQCIYGEAHECRELHLDDADVITQQLARYKAMGIPRNMQVYLGGVIVRKHTQDVQRACEWWWAEICRWSLRDQISMPVAFRYVKKKVQRVKVKENEFFWKEEHSKPTAAYI